MLIDNLSPVLFTLAITLMGVEIAPEHPWLAFVCISAAVAIYGVRAAILQVRYARSQEKLTKAMIAAEQASRAKSQFLANMSHEIRTPMNGILGMTELALSTTLSEEQRDFLLTVKSSADRLLSIINEILDYSKMEAGKTVLDSVAFHLPSVVKDVLRSLAFPAHQKGLELTVHIAPDVPADLTGDPIRLGQVLINLVGNAIKFTEHGEVCVEVSVEAVRTAALVCSSPSATPGSESHWTNRKDSSRSFSKPKLQAIGYTVVLAGTGRLQEHCDFDGRRDRSQEHARGGHNHNL